MDAEGPRERLKRVGVDALSDEELVALLLGTGSANEPVLALAARLLRDVGGVPSLAKWGGGALTQLRGIGESKASRLLAAIELGRRIHRAPWPRGATITSSRDVEPLVRTQLRDATTEHFLALALDAKNRVLAQLRIASGGLHQCPVAPADVFRAVLREAAVSVIFAHNHPSGDATPSPEDLVLTTRLAQAGALLGVRVLDHLIIARDGYFSFVDQRLLEPDPFTDREVGDSLRRRFA